MGAGAAASAEEIPVGGVEAMEALAIRI